MKREHVNFGVIGAGGIARRRTIPGMLKAKNCRLVAVMDTVDPERRGRRVQRFAGLSPRGRSAGRPEGRSGLHRLAGLLPRPADQVGRRGGKAHPLREAADAPARSGAKGRGPLPPPAGVPARGLHDEVPRGARADQATDRRGPARSRSSICVPNCRAGIRGSRAPGGRTRGTAEAAR